MEGAVVDETGGTALRLLHQIATSLPAAEALARCVPSAAGPLLGLPPPPPPLKCTCQETTTIATSESSTTYCS